MPSSRQLSRRNLLKLAAAGGLVALLYSPLAYFINKDKEKNTKVISSPWVRMKYEGLLDKLKKDELYNYNHSDTFRPYLDAWKDEAIPEFRKLGIPEEELLENKEKLPEKLMVKIARLGERHVMRSLRPDLFSDVKDLEKYIAENQIDFREVMHIVNTSKVALFGENHTIKKHKDFEQLLVRHSDTKDLAYITETLQIQDYDEIKKYFNTGDESILEKIIMPNIDDEHKEIKKKEIGIINEVRKRGINILPADVLWDLNEKIFPEYGTTWDDARQWHVREEIFGEQIEFAVNKGYRVLGSFGNQHLKEYALPKVLRKKGINSVVITGCNFTLDVFLAANKVSGDKDIFFKRGNTIVYVTPETIKIIRSRSFWEDF